MNRKQIVILLGALVLIGAAGFWSFKKDSSSWRSGGAAADTKVLREFDLNAVSQVAITTVEYQVHLVKKGDTWTVQERGDYPASFEAVGDLIRKLWELKVTESVPAGPSQLGRLNLEEPTKDKKAGGTLVDLQDAKGKRLAAILLGKPFVKKTPGMPELAGGMPIGRYVRSLEVGTNAALVSETFLNASGSAETWLDHTFYQAGAAQSVVSTNGAPADAWTINREKENGDWTLANAKPEEKLDQAKAGAAANALLHPTFTDVRKPSTKGFEKPTTLTLTGFDHVVYQLTIGAPENELLPVKVAISEAFPKARTPGAKETPEEKTKLDAEFANQTKALQERLNKEKRFADWVYLLPKSELEAALIARSSLLQPKATPTPAPGTALKPTVQ